jgi:hypothetical protein
MLLSEAPGEWSGSNLDWLGSGVEMQWDITGVEATQEHSRNASFTIVDEWKTTETFAGDDQQVVFFSTRLDT